MIKISEDEWVDHVTADDAIVTVKIDLASQHKFKVTDLID